MSLPRNLTGKRFGLLKAIKVDEERSTSRERFWHCECNCGRSKSVRASDLVAGKTKSCGCLAKKTGRRNGWKAPAVHRDYKAKDIVTWEGETLYSPRQAAKFLGRTYGLLHRWANLDPVRRREKNGKIVKEFKGCPYLNGETLKTIPIRGAQNRPIHYFPLEALQKVKNTMSAQVNTPEQDGLTYVGKAIRELGVSLRTLRDKLKKWNPSAKPEKRHGRGKDGFARMRAYVPTEFVEWMATGAGKQLVSDADTVTIKKAAEKLNISEDMIRYYIERGRLDVERVENIIETKAGKNNRPSMRYVRKGLRVSSASLERLKNELRGIAAVAPRADSAVEVVIASAAQDEDTRMQGIEAPPRRRRGPRRLQQTLDIGELCYRLLSQDVLRRIIAERVRDRFDRVMSESDVTTYARRYAKDVGKPWPV